MHHSRWGTSPRPATAQPSVRMCLLDSDFIAENALACIWVLDLNFIQTETSFPPAFLGVMKRLHLKTDFQYIQMWIHSSSSNHYSWWSTNASEFEQWYPSTHFTDTSFFITYYLLIQKYNKGTKIKKRHWQN